jgi:hypothetical protein
MGTVTIATVDYEVYGDEAGADAYWGGGLGDGATAWAAADATQHKKALVAATRLLDRQPWQGTAVGTPVIDVVLQWPRSGVSGVADNEVPDAIVKGSYELAAAILSDTSILNAAVSGSNVRAVKAGSVEVEFFTNTLGISGRLPAQVQDLVGQYLQGAGAGASSSISYGTDGTSESEYDDADIYTITGPGTT